MDYVKDEIAITELSTEITTNKEVWYVALTQINWDKCNKTMMK